MKELLVIMLCTLLLAGCGEGANQSGPATSQTTDMRQRTYDKDALARGERVFSTNCAVCHGYSGEAKPGWQKPGPDGKLPPPPLDDNGRAWRLTRSQMNLFIRQGSPDGRGNMPAWQGKLSDLEIDNVVTYTTSLWSDAVYLQWLTEVEQPRN